MNSTSPLILAFVVLFALAIAGLEWICETYLDEDDQ